MSDPKAAASAAHRAVDILVPALYQALQERYQLPVDPKVLEELKKEIRRHKPLNVDRIQFRETVDITVPDGRFFFTVEVQWGTRMSITAYGQDGTYLLQVYVPFELEFTGIVVGGRPDVTLFPEIRWLVEKALEAFAGRKGLVQVRTVVKNELSSKFGPAA